MTLRGKEYRDWQMGQQRHGIVFKAPEKPKAPLVLSTLADPPHLIDKGADADGAPLEEIQTGLVVLVVDK